MNTPSKARDRATTTSKKRPAIPTTAPATNATEQELKKAIWEAPDDLDRISVWADFLCEAGDPRGEFLQVHLRAIPTGHRSEHASALEKKLGGVLVGPARAHVREWTFDQTGMVNLVGCEAAKLIEGWEQISWLHPRLTVCVTSLRKQTMATIAKLVELPLSRIYYLRLEANALSDRAFAALGPGLRGVRNLNLSGNDLSPDGLAKLGPYVGSLEFLCLNANRSNPSCNGFAEVIAATPAFHNLKAIHFYSYGAPDEEHLAPLRELPNMKTVRVSDYSPGDANTIDAWKRG